MKIFELKGRSYATPKLARRKLLDLEGAVGSATTLIAVDPDTPGRYFPVVIYREGTDVNVGFLLYHGVTVMN